MKMVTTVNFKEELVSKVASVDRIIETFLPGETTLSKDLAKAMNYSMKAGGKRLRPLLMAETFKAFYKRDWIMSGQEEGSVKVLWAFMAALEMIHTHSLIHDDLPALDNDSLRRGVATTHVVFGEDIAILAGDALLNYAYETAFTSFDTENADKERIGRALQILGEKTGLFGMLGGQSVDVKNEKKAIDYRMLEYIYANKTGALLEAAFMIGATLAGADRHEIFAMEGIGYKVGFAFQIQDDILDITGSEQELGKPLFSDDKNNKVTYVTLRGMEEAKRQVKLLTKEAVSALEEIAPGQEFLLSLIESLTGRKK